MCEKRFLYRNFLGEEVEKRFTGEYDEKWGIYLSDNLTGDWYNINPVDIVDTCNNLWEQVVKLRGENEQLRLELETNKHPLWSTREVERKLSEVTNNLANEVKKNGLLNEEINQLRIENMRLKKKGGGNDE